MANNTSLILSSSLSAATVGGLSGLGNVNPNNALLTVGNNGASTTYSGMLSGGSGLVKVGGGVLTLTNTQNYAGPTTVLGGGLQLLSPAACIGIKFSTNSTGGTYPVSSTVGVVPMGNWNNLTGYVNQTAAGLVDSSNNPTTASVAWNTTDTWDVFGANESSFPNAQLMNSYLDNTGGTETVGVSGIPYANYSVYVYVASDVNGREGTLTIGRLGCSFSTDANNGPSPYAFTEITSPVGTYGTGNYAVFSGLSSSSFTINETRLSNCGIAAVEIVPTTPAFALNLLPVTTPLSVASGATFDLGGGTQQLASLSDATPGLGGSIQNSGSTAAVLTLSSTGGSTTFSGLIAGGGSLGSINLIVEGAGLQNLAGTNTYTGGTTITPVHCSLEATSPSAPAD